MITKYCEHIALRTKPDYTTYQEFATRILRDDVDELDASIQPLISYLGIRDMLKHQS